ncbi:histidine kinase [bacterium]|nr:histidine kinase [bacterium]
MLPGRGAVRPRAAGPAVSIDPDRIAAGGGAFEGNRRSQPALFHEVAGGWLAARWFRGRFFSFWPLQISGWTLSFVVPLLFVVTGSVMDPSHLWLAFTRPLNGFLITLALRPCCSWALTRFGKHWLLVPALLVVSLVISYVELMGVSGLIWAFGFPGVTRQIWLAVLAIRMATLMIWLLLYFGIKSIMLHSAIEREFQQSELKLLRSQVNPHFLFNALATIMAVRKDEEMVSQVTQSLADYLRFSLAQESQDQFLHPLGQELAALENYLRVEKIRFQERLETRIEVSEQACAAHVPTALIQPLLENAFKYGQKTSPPPLCIAIEARLSEGRLLLMVENTGRWVEPHGSESTGLGIANLRKRLHLLYGDQAQLTLDCTATAVRAHVSIPVSGTA